MLKKYWKNTNVVFDLEKVPQIKSLFFGKPWKNVMSTILTCTAYLLTTSKHLSIKRSALLNILKKNGIPIKLVNLVRVTMENASSKVRIGNKVGESFRIKSGLRQGDALSATLFNIALHEAVKDAVKQGTITEKTWQVCAYADDLVIMARSENKLTEAFKIVFENGIKVGLQINESKTKYLKLLSAAHRRSLIKYKHSWVKVRKCRQLRISWFFHK